MASPRVGPVVVLTGANQGIGSHLLQALVDNGYRVAALDVEGDRIQKIQERSPDQVQFHECDVSEANQVDTAVAEVCDQWDRIDILVNNAAVATFAPFDEQSAADTRREFEVNVFGYLHLIRAVLPQMRARSGGVIHNMGSATGDVGHPGLAGYAATKGAIAALTRSLRLELRDTGVSCTLMLPPTTDTRMSAELGYPQWMVSEPADVGRKLASKIESTEPVITPDWQTSLGRTLVRRVPALWETLTDRYVDFGE